MQNNLAKKNILVTGATGLVGGHVVEALLKKGAKVFALSRTYSADSYTAKKHGKRVVSVKADINDFGSLHKIVESNKIEYIFHLAAQLKLVSLYETFAFNISGTNNVLESARRVKTVKGVILASSNRAFYVESGLSKNNMQKFAEDPYNVSKMSAELIAKNYINKYNLPVVIARFGNVYGPGDLQKRIVPTLFKCALNQEVFSISVKKSFRNYIYAADIANGLVLIAEKMESLKANDINFETKDNFSAEALAKKISEVLKKKIHYNFTKNAYQEIAIKSPKKNLAGKLLGWKPLTPMAKGLLQTYNWYHNQ